MDLIEVMRTTFACREFTDEVVPDTVLYRILDTARFAPSGGNRQGAHVVVVRDPSTRQRLGELCKPTVAVYAAQREAGEVPFNTVVPTEVDIRAARTTGKGFLPLFEHLDKAPVVLVITVDLAAVASMDKDLDRIGLVTGGSVYPLVWNVLLAARNEGLGGVLTTLVVPEEEAVRELLGFPDTHGVAALVPLGRPSHQLTKLRRQAVEDFVTVDRYDGQPLTGSAD